MVDSIRSVIQISFNALRPSRGRERTVSVICCWCVALTCAMPVPFALGGSQTSDDTDHRGGAMGDEARPSGDVQSGEAQSRVATANLLFVSDFESGGIQPKGVSPDGWDIQSGDLPGANVVTDKLARRGAYSVRFTLRREDWEGESAPNIKPRAQLNKPARFLPIQQDTEYWMGVSMYIPSDGWDQEMNPENQTVFWQFHGTTGAVIKSPPLVLHLIGNRLQIVNRSGDAKGPSWRSDVLWRQEGIEKDVWIDWIVRVNFSRKSTGFVQIWKNGVQIVDKRNAPTLYYTRIPDENERVTIALSLYKGRFVKRFTSVDSLTMYYDEFRFAQGANGYEVVDPAG